MWAGSTAKIANSLQKPLGAATGLMQMHHQGMLGQDPDARLQPEPVQAQAGSSWAAPQQEALGRALSGSAFLQHHHSEPLLDRSSIGAGEQSPHSLPLQDQVAFSDILWRGALSCTPQVLVRSCDQHRRIDVQTM
jgi:hypothetical protein